MVVTLASLFQMCARLWPFRKPPMTARYCLVRAVRTLLCGVVVLVCCSVVGMTAHAGSLQVPVEVGAGPSAFIFTGQVFEDQPVHFGLALSAAAVLDRKFLKKHKKRVPARYRALISRMDEVRISYWWLPDTLIISPPVWGGTQMYGISWRPLSLGVPLVKKGVRITASVGPRLTWLFIHSTSIPSPTHFLRPGLDARLNMEIPVSQRFRFSVGGASQVYIPQRIGAGFFEIGPMRENIWHIGQLYLKFQVRFPMRVSL